LILLLKRRRGYQQIAMLEHGGKSGDLSPAFLQPSHSVILSEVVVSEANDYAVEGSLLCEQHPMPEEEFTRCRAGKIPTARKSL
jgi:hypothetical protein